MDYTTRYEFVELVRSRPWEHSARELVVLGGLVERVDGWKGCRCWTRLPMYHGGNDDLVAALHDTEESCRGNEWQESVTIARSGRIVSRFPDYLLNCVKTVQREQILDQIRTTLSKDGIVVRNSTVHFAEDGDDEHGFLELETTTDEYFSRQRYFIASKSQAPQPLTREDKKS